MGWAQWGGASKCCAVTDDRRPVRSVPDTCTGTGLRTKVAAPCHEVAWRPPLRVATTRIFSVKSPRHLHTCRVRCSYSTNKIHKRRHALPTTDAPGHVGADAFCSAAAASFVFLCEISTPASYTICMCGRVCKKQALAASGCIWHTRTCRRARQH